MAKKFKLNQLLIWNKYKCWYTDLKEIFSISCRKSTFATIETFKKKKKDAVSIRVKTNFSLSFEIFSIKTYKNPILT